MGFSIGQLNEAYRNYFMDHQERVSRDLKRLGNFLIDHHCTFRGMAMPSSIERFL